MASSAPELRGTQVTRLLPVGTEATALAVTEVEARLTGGEAA